MKQMWLILSLAVLMELAAVAVWDAQVSPTNCGSGDAALCLETFFYVE